MVSDGIGFLIGPKVAFNIGELVKPQSRCLWYRLFMEGWRYVSKLIIL